MCRIIRPCIAIYVMTHFCVLCHFVKTVNRCHKTCSSILSNATQRLIPPFIVPWCLVVYSSWYLWRSISQQRKLSTTILYVLLPTKNSNFCTITYHSLNIMCSIKSHFCEVNTDICTSFIPIYSMAVWSHISSKTIRLNNNGLVY